MNNIIEVQNIHISFVVSCDGDDISCEVQHGAGTREGKM